MSYKFAMSCQLFKYCVCFRSAYEEEILETIVIPTFTNIAYENDPKIRTSVGDLLLNFVAQCDTKRSIELLDIVEKLLNRPFDRFNDDNRLILKNDEELTHITMIIDELIRVSNFWVTNSKYPRYLIMLCFQFLHRSFYRSYPPYQLHMP